MGVFSRNISNSNNSRSIPTAEDSLAVKAYQSQNLNTDDPRETSYSQHDNFQNGVLKNGQAATFYRQVTDDELKEIKNGNSNINSFLTDENTVKSCVDENGVANQNALSNKTQTEPYVRVDHQNGHNGWYEDENANYRNGVAAFDVNWDKLNAPENRDIKERLCNPDGRSPGSNDIKMAYGTAEANKQFGEGGGNQYYLDRDTFNEAVNRGIFEYNPNKSYVGDKCQNTSVPMKEAAHGKALAENDSRDQLASYSDASTDIEKADKINRMNADENKINSYENPQQNFVTEPDPAYGYMHKNNDNNASKDKDNGNTEDDQKGKDNRNAEDDQKDKDNSDKGNDKDAEAAKWDNYYGIG